MTGPPKTRKETHGPSPGALYRQLKSIPGVRSATASQSGHEISEVHVVTDGTRPVREIRREVIAVTGAFLDRELPSDAITVEAGERDLAEADEPFKRDDRREAAKERLRRFGDEVSYALRQRGLSRSRAAKLIGVSPGAFHAWTSGGARPDPLALEAIARITELDWAYLVDLLGYAPANLRSGILQLQTLQRLSNAATSLEHTLQQARDLLTSRRAATLAGAVLQSPHWTIGLSTEERGTTYRTVFLTNVEVSSTDKTLRTPQQMRVAFLEEFSEILTRLGCWWREPGRRKGQSELLLAVPEFFAVLPSGRLRNLSVPESICVVGLPYSGAPNVARLLASALDWAYISLVDAAGRGGLPTSPEQAAVASYNRPHRVREQTAVANRLLERPRDDGRFLVWAYDEPEAIEATTDALRPDLPLVIYLRLPAELIEYSASRIDPNDAELPTKMAVIQQAIERRLARRSTRSYVQIEVREPGSALAPGQLENVDQWFDQWVRHAIEAVDWLRVEHDGPKPEEISETLLGEMWIHAIRLRDPSIKQPRSRDVQDEP